MSKNNKNIFLIFGEDEFAVKNKSRAIIASLCGENFEENPALEIINGDPDEKESPEKLVGQIIESIYTPSFFSDEKIVWAKNFQFETITGEDDKISSGKKDKKNSSSGEIFTNLLDLVKSGIPEKITLVLTIFNMDKRSTFYKACVKVAESYEFEKITSETKNLSEILYSQIEASSRELGIKISEDAKNLIIEACGASHARIINELEKIAAYIHPKTEANLDDCLQVCSMTPHLASWAFSEAIGRKDIKSALRAIDILLLTEKTSEHKMLYPIIKLFTEIAQVKIAAKALNLDKCTRYPEFDYKLKNADSALKEKYSWTSILSMNTYRAFKLLEQSKKFSEKEIADAFKEILKVNKDLVSGAANPRLEIENLTIKLCQNK